MFIRVYHHCYYTGKYRSDVHNICTLRYKRPKEISVVNGSNYDYHFIIEKLTETFEEQFEWLGENTEKYITFTAPIKKKNKNGNSDSVWFMTSSLSNLTDNLAEGLHQGKCEKYKSGLIMPHF